MSKLVDKIIKRLGNRLVRRSRSRRAKRLTAYIKQYTFPSVDDIEHDADREGDSLQDFEEEHGDHSRLPGD